MDRPYEDPEDVTPDDRAVRIVAIGASAGGLEPFEKFFDTMLLDNGLAFVVIQHLSPNFKSMMDELLARHSAMAIHRIEEGMLLEPNAIYLNQPRLEATVANGRFRTTDMSSSDNLNLPIDAFFQSLAKEKGPEAIGVILSGTGSDGLKGCEAIKSAGGAVFVQEPSSAKFDGMPNSVINQRLADAIATPDKLAGIVLQHTRGELSGDAPAGSEPQSPKDFIFQLLVDRFGTDFRWYKMTTIERRIRRRYEMRGLNDLQDYADLLAADRDEISALYNDLLIDVTAFFRDAEAFHLMERKVIPEIAKRMSADNQIRIWVPGCSSGEEPYSHAMLMADYAREKGLELNVKILATDIHHRSLDSASAGIYPEESLKSVSAERIGRYFEKQGSYYHIRQEIRRLVVFTPHSVFRDPPFTRMDLVSCRNMLIYFKEPAQHKALALFHFALNKDGHLFLGPSETIGRLSNEFDTIDQRWRIFKKKRDVRLVESTTILRNESGASQGPKKFAMVLPHGGTRDLNLTRPESRRAFNDALQSLLTQYAPPGFLLSRDGDVVHIFGDAGKFIRVGEGGFSTRINDLVSDDIKLAVSAGLERLKTSVSVPFERRATTEMPNGGIAGINIRIEGLPDSSGEIEFLLMTIEQDVRPAGPDEAAFSYIEDGEATSALQGRISELERDLRSTEESLQTTIEELETSNEELQATNEELMASNEELQSTNEELHSVNEELYTVSAEHQRKIEELTDLTNDMDQLLKSTEIGTVFLDKDLRIRRFTPAATRTFNLISQDLSRPFDHITHRFDDDLVRQMLAKVVETKKVAELELEAAGRYYLLRILPFTPIIDGPMEYVISAIDIDELRQANARIAEMAEFYRGILSDIAEYILRWRSEDGEITYCNEAYADLLELKPEDVIGSNIFEHFETAEHKGLLEDLKGLKPGETVARRNRHFTDKGQEIFREGSIRAIGDETGKLSELQSTSRNATQDIKYLEALEALMEASQPAEDSYEERIDQFLTIGCTYFNLDHGMIKRVSGQQILLETYHGPARDAFPVGRLTDITENLCSEVIANKAPFFEHDLARGSYKTHPAVTEQQRASYIGAPIYKDGEVYATVCFFSLKVPRAHAFTTPEVGFILLLSRWLGYKIESQDQIAALQQRETELQRIFHNVPARIWYKDDKNTILRLNETAAKSMNVTVEEGTGANTYALFPEMAKKYHEDDLAALKSGKSLTRIVEEYTPQNGEHGWVTTDKVPFIDVDGERKLLVVSTDISALKRQEIELLKLNRELEQANDGLRQFAYVASHDLQEPLRKIRQFSELLEEAYQSELDDDGRYFLSVVSSSATRMSGLIRDLLSYSKTAHQDLETEDLNLSDLVKDVQGQLQLLLNEADGQIKIGKLPTVSGDRTMIFQLFTNLFSNAIKYREPNRNPLVEIRSKSRAKHYDIVVKDNGMGIETEFLDMIFDPFTRLHSQESLKGSGIGLAICRSVCERHGWVLSVDSEVGRGTEFKITIPK